MHSCGILNIWWGRNTRPWIQTAILCCHTIISTNILADVTRRSYQTDLALNRLINGKQACCQMKIAMSRENAAWGVLSKLFHTSVNNINKQCWIDIQRGKSNDKIAYLWSCLISMNYNSYTIPHNEIEFTFSVSGVISYINCYSSHKESTDHTAIWIPRKIDICIYTCAQVRDVAYNHE